MLELTGMATGLALPQAQRFQPLVPDLLYPGALQAGAQNQELPPCILPSPHHQQVYRTHLGPLDPQSAGSSAPQCPACTGPPVHRLAAIVQVFTYPMHRPKDQGGGWL